MQDKKIINIAEGEIEKFVKIWQRFPYKWDKEADIHAEIYSRINSALKSYRLSPSKCENYWQKQEYFNWVYCKPYTYYKKNGKKGRYEPDIVIYKRNKKPIKDGFNYPMMWVCEVKYKTEWGGDFHNDHRKDDINKLKLLLRQRNKNIKGTDYAYCLFLNRETKPKKDEKLYKRTCCLEEKTDNRGRLKICTYTICYKKNE